jgi:hypothetical protein
MADRRYAMVHACHGLLPLFALLLLLGATSCKRERTLMLESQPSPAAVWQGDDIVGTTPCRIAPPAEGELSLLLTAPGCQDSVLTIPAGMITPDGRLLVKLAQAEKLGVSLRCQSTPSGAELFLDGEFQGRTPLIINGLELRTIELIFRMKDRDAVTKQVDLSSGGAAQTIHVKLPSQTLAFYRNKIKEEPLSPHHYADLGHHLILEHEFTEAAAVFKEGLLLVLDGKASEGGHRLWSEVDRVIVKQYDYGDAAALKAGREAMLALLRDLHRERKEIRNLQFYINYINCADALNFLQEAQERFADAWELYPDHKQLQPYLKRGYAP